VFKTIQTYSDGTVVRWIDDTVAGQAEPEHPAPVLNLAAAAPDGGAAAAPSAAVSMQPAPQAVAPTSRESRAIGLGIAGALLGLAGLVPGALAYGRARRATVPAPERPAAEPARTA
jgi:periplasmic copper chaperone A